MMKVLIIEDEPVAAERLEDLLYEVDPSIHVLSKIGSVKESVKWFLNNQADLIFLDVQLSDGLSFTIFEQVEVSTPVIFTTAYDQYAIKAFQLNSIAYLLKPVRKSELEESLKKLDTLKSAFKVDFDDLLSMIKGNQPEYKKRFVVQIGEKIIKVESLDIAYFFAMEKSVFIKTFKNQILPIDFSLDKLENRIDPSKFFRINRKFIVNIDSITNMTALSRSRIKLHLKPDNDPNLDSIVSIERSSDFKEWLNG